MWLINAKSYELKEFLGNVPPYAILSHTWGEDEVTFAEMSQREGQDKKGYPKIRMTCEQALKDGLGWAWVDTCCIDKKSSAELSEAINSMFQWYESAAVCYTYLADMILAEADSLRQLFRRCRWRTRGWTLQELLAPRDVVFYDFHWNMIGNKFGLSAILSDVTDIAQGYIITTLPLSSANVAEKMSWASPRSTTREEDGAYCLLGIFDVNMPLLYGEGGSGAFLRLQEEILKKAYDPTIFGCFLGLRKNNIASLPFAPPNPSLLDASNLLASGPKEFSNAGNLEINPDWPDWTENIPTVQNGTICVSVPIIEPGPSDFTCRVKFVDPVVLALFGFRCREWGCDTLALVLRRWRDNLYGRELGENVLAVRIPVPDSSYLRSHVRTICVKQNHRDSQEAFSELRVAKKLLYRFPGGFKLQNLITVPPTTYDRRTRWLYNLSEREGAIFALIYCHPFGNRFALLFIRLQFGEAIRPIDLGRLNTRHAVYTSPEDQSRRSSRDHYDGSELALLEIPEYKLESYFQDLREAQGPVDEVNDYLLFPVILQISNHLKIKIYKHTVTPSHSQDEIVDAFRFQVYEVPITTVPDWKISGI
ncbi:HET-domain-containing protein [Xylariaceae sp. AK1471]|nr:HET-domain-containing protein [Xylariaceae sp. AK1471]